MPALTASALLVLSTAALPAVLHAQDWPVYGGDPGGMKYSSLDQIHRGNVTSLELAWTWETGEQPIPAARRAFSDQEIWPGPFEATPIVINDTMYVSTPYSRVVAIDADTGRELWSYDPRAYDWGMLARGCGFCHRGVAAWTDGRERRIFLNTRWRLIALDAATGEPIRSFGHGGEVDLTKDLLWEVNRLHYTNTSPPVVFGDLVIVGSGMPDDRIYERNPPGDVQAFDVRTGKRVWVFHTIPQAGEVGNETWEEGSWSYTGSTNVWGPFTVDEARGLVYLPVSTPNSDFYGGHRKGDNLFAESIVCLDARTGKLVWYFQTVHHGVWDYDIPAPPNLVTIEVDGRTIDAVVVVSKTGFAYVFDRVTGEPVWPIEERPVPESDVPGERTALTQPFPVKPPPFSKQGFSEEDVIDFTPELREMALELLREYRTGSIFTPPSLQGTVIMPGLSGGSDWGGAAFDPESHVLYVKGHNQPHVLKLGKPEPGEVDSDYVLVRSPSLRVADGLPINRPPYSVLTAIDLDRGVHLWQVTFGDTPEIKGHPMLAGIELPQLGVLIEGHGFDAGPLVTAGGLVFLGGGSTSLHAIDSSTGEDLWQGDLDGGRALANPMSYQTRSGRRFVVVATSSHDGKRAKLMAFALPR